MNEDEAVEYLRSNCNFYRVKAYKSGFPKVNDGRRKGQYANLDFAMLVDLSIIDMLLRQQLLPMSLDIEHFAKIDLLNRLEATGEDGYEIVQSYVDSKYTANADGTRKNSLLDEIDRGKDSPYVKALVNKHPDHLYPAWAFLELISFGTFTHFYNYCAKHIYEGGDNASKKAMLDNYYLLMAVKSMRNACAHNNCIINDLGPQRLGRRLDTAISREVGAIASIGKRTRDSRMDNERVRQIVTTLYMHRILATAGVKLHRADSLHVFTSRMMKNLTYYQGNQVINSTFLFLEHIIDSWFPNRNG